MAGTATKERLAKMLEENRGSFLSGSRIAEQLGITRAAVWKQIRSLMADGYEIDAVTNRGYRLGDRSDVITKEGLLTALGEEGERYTLEVHESITSTNTVLKERAEDLPDWYVIVSGRQTAGRGRIGRSFYSPEATGIYLSVLLRPALPAEQSVRITTAAAVAACRAIEETTDRKPGIKWVNDVFVEGRKACGILTEGSLNLETGGLDWVVMGIGFNVYEPEGGFPEEIREIAGPVAAERAGDLRVHLAGSFLRHFGKVCDSLAEASFAEEYRKRSIVTGQNILVLRNGQEIPAFAEDIDGECRLRVRYADGREELLSSGDVSIRRAGDPAKNA